MAASSSSQVRLAITPIGANAIFGSDVALVGLGNPLVYERRSDSASMTLVNERRTVDTNVDSQDDALGRQKFFASIGEDAFRNTQRLRDPLLHFSNGGDLDLVYDYPIDELIQEEIDGILPQSFIHSAISFIAQHRE